MAILGLFGTDNLAANQAPEDWLGMVLQLWPNGTAPITALTTLLQRKKTTNPKFHWWTKQYETRILTTNGNVASGSGGTGAGTNFAITVLGSANFAYTNVILFCPATGEYLRVAADATSDTALPTVQRGVGLAAGTAVAAIPSGSQLTIIGSAFPEGSRSPSGIGQIPVENSNLVQIFKSAVEHTETEMATELRTGNQEAWDKAEAMKRHSVDIERAILFGKQSIEYDSRGKARRTTDGLNTIIQTNRANYAGNGTYRQLDAFYKNLFLYGDPERLGYCGNDYISKMNFLIEDKTNWVTEGVVTEYGMDFTRLVTPYGKVLFKTHPLLNTDPYYNNSCWHIAPGNMVYRPLRETFLKPNVQENDEDTKKDMWITEAGYEFHHEQTFGLIQNL